MAERKGQGLQRMTPGRENNPALRRVAEYGDGWIGFNLLPDQAAQKIKRIDGHAS